jgi:hypothetical protein
VLKRVRRVGREGEKEKERGKRRESTCNKSSAEGRIVGFTWKHWLKKSLKRSPHFSGFESESAPFVAV